jgi:hypothetical protein
MLRLSKGRAWICKDTAKGRIADAMPAFVHPMFDRQTADGLDAAREGFDDALRKDLRAAYDVDSIVQFALRPKAKGFGKEPELLCGDVVEVNATGDPQAVSALGAPAGSLLASASDRRGLCP